MSSETSDALDQAMVRSSGLDTLLHDLTDRRCRRCRAPPRAASPCVAPTGCSPWPAATGLPSGLDLRQYENGSGPCVEAAETGAEQYAADLAAESRWPSYTRYALSAGVRCVLAVPIAVEGETGAALNFYGERPGALGAGREAARSFAARAGDAINVALRIERRRQSAADVRTALLSRSVIDQAIGILMARERIDARIALERLRRISQDRNVKLRDLCDQVVARVSRPADPASRRRK